MSLPAYFTGYISGCIGEQVAVGVLTAGVTKIGWVGKALREGAVAAQRVLAGVDEATAKIQKMARGFTIEFGRCARSTDELRDVRRSGSLCRTTAGCFAAGTLVVMGDGSFRPIEKVHSGDSVLAADPNHPSAVQAQTVSSQVYNTASQTVTISWDEDHNGTIDGSVSATLGHPFYVPGIGWKPARTLKPGMPLQTMSGKYATVITTSTTSLAVPTYNLDVNGPDTFFVASRGSAVLVHNIEGDVYPYGDPIPGRPRGTSQDYRKVGGSYVPQFETNGMPKMRPNEMHHFYWNAWLENKFKGQGYVSYQRGIPCVELSYIDHRKVHDAAYEWFQANPKFGKMPSGAEWKNVSLEEMEELCKHMMQAINMPEIKINTLKNYSGGYLRQTFKLSGCK